MYANMNSAHLEKCLACKNVMFDYTFNVVISMLNLVSMQWVGAVVGCSGVCLDCPDLRACERCCHVPGYST